MLPDATSLDCYAEESEDGLSYSVAIIVSKVDNYVHLWQCIHHSSFHQVKKKYTAYMPLRCSLLGPSFRECLLPLADRRESTTSQFFFLFALLSACCCYSGIISDEIITCAEERSMMDGRSFRSERRMCSAVRSSSLRLLSSNSKLRVLCTDCLRCAYS